jgi:hypothetical protein
MQIINRSPQQIKCYRKVTALQHVNNKAKYTVRDHETPTVETSVPTVGTLPVMGLTQYFHMAGIGFLL